MESNKQHFRHILLFYYRKGKNAVQARKKLTDVYGEDVLTVRQCQNWFAKFRSGNFDVKDASCSGRPVKADKDTIKALVDANRRITTPVRSVRGLGLTSKLDIWVPHVLTERNLCRRVDVCDSLLKRHENDPFLKRIITGDEKWIVYNNVKRKRSWSKKKWIGSKHFQSQYPSKKVYCHQLDKLNDAFQQKRPELINRKDVVFHQDNARPHINLTVKPSLQMRKSKTTSISFLPAKTKNFMSVESCYYQKDGKRITWLTSAIRKVHLKGNLKLRSRSGFSTSTSPSLICCIKGLVFGPGASSEVIT
ncbi:histone-lysine N-methyltransferase SETMAR-like [Vespa crabro]|uniref:histone-lysine N-methyltransferase SETMAR-like n=1 Tax=Vespa crabro TaxID=7445 RepID=UPI001F02B459|nr:histone-lysine N-methyltransferase SETMAR-like [Vespa crabro]